MRKKEKTEILSFRVGSRLRNALENEAEKEDRPLSHQVIHILKQYFRGIGVDIDGGKEVTQEPTK